MGYDWIPKSSKLTMEWYSQISPSGKLLLKSFHIEKCILTLWLVSHFAAFACRGSALVLTIGAFAGWKHFFLGERVPQLHIQSASLWMASSRQHRKQQLMVIGGEALYGKQKTIVSELDHQTGQPVHILIARCEGGGTVCMWLHSGSARALIDCKWIAALPKELRLATSCCVTINWCKSGACSQCAL